MRNQCSYRTKSLTISLKDKQERQADYEDCWISFCFCSIHFHLPWEVNVDWVADLSLSRTEDLNLDKC